MFCCEEKEYVISLVPQITGDSMKASVEVITENHLISLVS